MAAGKITAVEFGSKIVATKIIRTIIAAVDENCTNALSAFVENLCQ